MTSPDAAGAVELSTDLGATRARSRVGAGGCEICGSAASAHSVQRATDYITGVSFAVRRCLTCGFGSTDPLPPSMERFYPPTYRKYTGFTERVLRMLYRWRVRGWSKRLPREGCALEVGCGHGWMLGALRERGWRVMGNERSTEGARSAAALNKVAAFVGDLDALRSAPRFDLIILFQVLEHLAEPFATLRQSAQLLEPGGMVVVAVPNFAGWQARVFGTSWFHLDVPRHAHHFSPTALRLAFEKAGLKVVSTRFVSFEHDPYGWIQSVLNSMGFKQNLLTKWFMGMAGDEGDAVTIAAMVAVSGVLLGPSLVLALWSWAAGSGAIMEMWATKP